MSGAIKAVWVISIMFRVGIISDCSRITMFKVLLVDKVWGILEAALLVLV